jgi:hypothetical protein
MLPILLFPRSFAHVHETNGGMSIALDWHAVERFPSEVYGF